MNMNQSTSTINNTTNSNLNNHSSFSIPFLSIALSFILFTLIIGIIYFIYIYFKNKQYQQQGIILNSLHNDNHNTSSYKELPKNSISTSTVHKPSTNSKLHQSGYCYIGTQQGKRSCIKIDDDDQCMSKNIFPSMDICIHPNLRT